MGPLLVDVVEGHRWPAGIGVVRVAAQGTPARDQRQVRGLAPPEVRFEQVVLEHEVVRVGPVVGNVSTVVETHDIWACALGPAGRLRCVVPFVAEPAGGIPLGDEAVHLAVVDVCFGGVVGVGPAVVRRVRVVVGSAAATGRGVGNTDAESPVLPRDPVRSGVGAEVVVERSVLLHDDDDVLDLPDRRRQRRRARARPGRAGPVQDGQLRSGRREGRVGRASLVRGRASRHRGQRLVESVSRNPPSRGRHRLVLQNHARRGGETIRGVGLQRGDALQRLPNIRNDVGACHRSDRLRGTSCTGVTEVTGEAHHNHSHARDRDQHTPQPYRRTDPPAPGRLACHAESPEQGRRFRQACNRPNWAHHDRVSGADDTARPRSSGRTRARTDVVDAPGMRPVQTWPTPGRAAYPRCASRTPAGAVHSGSVLHHHATGLTPRARVPRRHS
jgi:hypothetical protein